MIDVCQNHIHFANLPLMRPRRRALARAASLHLASTAPLPGQPPQPVHIRLPRRRSQRAAARAPLLTGADALALGVPEGPLVGELLRAVERQLDAQDDGEPTREQALAALRLLAAPHVKPGP
jgi:hypothetical protein